MARMSRFTNKRTLPDGMREKVLAAADLFAEFGMDETKMEGIAAATGVPKATLYYHFEGKADILAYLFGEVLDELAVAVEGAMQMPGNAADRLRAVIAAHIDVIVRYPAASRALQFDLGRAARVPLIAERVGAAHRIPLRQLLEEGAGDGSLRTDGHPGLVATAIIGAVTTVGINALTIDDKRTATEVVETLAELIMKGIAV
jgi:TetR/AcrR family transcriptional regulator